VRAIPSDPVFFVATLTLPPPPTTENVTGTPVIGKLKLSVTLTAIESAISKPPAVEPNDWPPSTVMNTGSSPLGPDESPPEHAARTTAAHSIATHFITLSLKRSVEC
jgi:hypothetical protein